MTSSLSVSCITALVTFARERLMLGLTGGLSLIDSLNSSNVHLTPTIIHESISNKFDDSKDSHELLPT